MSNRSVSVPMTSSDLERRDARNQKYSINLSINLFIDVWQLHPVQNNNGIIAAAEAGVA